MIDTGQSLIMKYKLNTEKIMLQNINTKNGFSNNILGVGTKRSIAAPVAIQPMTVSIINQMVGNFWSRIWFWLLKKICFLPFLIALVPLNTLQRKSIKTIGIMISAIGGGVCITLQITPFVQWIFASNPNVIRILVPIQNRKFHLRSLVSQLSFLLLGLTTTGRYIFGCVSCFIKISKDKLSTNFIVTNKCFKAKGFKLFGRLLLLYVTCFGSICSSFASSLIYNKEMLEGIITKAEQRYGILPGLLISIARHESNVSPWVIGSSGRAITNSNLNEASSKVTILINEGKTNIDIGVMQLNYHFHKNNFSSIDEMLLPENNINYAAFLLSNLYKKHKSWQTAIRYYHSKNAVHNRPYSRKIVMEYLGINNIKKL